MVTMRFVPLLTVSFFTAFIYSGIGEVEEVFAPGVCVDEAEGAEVQLPLVAPEPEPQRTVDPYAGWQNWCEPVDYQTTCETHDDCKGANPDHPAHRPMRCYNPWYAKGNPDYKICAPGYARKNELDWREGRLREIVSQQYSGEADTCVLDGRPIHKEGWKCQRDKRLGDILTNFLLMPYDRETGRRPWKRHRLDADRRANVTAWYNMAGVYGWEVALDKYGEAITVVNKHPEWANPYYDSRPRWHFGLGPFGQNAPLYLRYWDVKAPPEVLCREVEPVEAYLRNARRIVKNLRNGIRCNGEYYEDRSPTWTVIHRAASRGKICPSTGDEKPKAKAQAAKKLANFRSSAKKHDLDPDQVVTMKMLGQVIPEQGQNARAAEIYAVFDEKWPVENMVKKH